MSTKIKNLNFLVKNKGLQDSTEGYQKFTDFRNNVAHKYDYVLKEDKKFYGVLDIVKGTENELRTAISKRFIHLLHVLLYIDIGISVSYEISDFIKFEKVVTSN